MSREACRALILCVTGVFGGCVSVGPVYEVPATLEPDAWFYGTTLDLSEDGSALDTWWTSFNDPVLTELIGRAKDANPNVRIALSRIYEARAARGAATGTLGPSINAQGSYSRTRVSENSLSPPLSQNPFDQFALGFDASWELDFFGGRQRTIESALASEQAAIESYRDALVTLYSEVALNYVDMRTFELRLRFARENLTLQEESKEITDDRFESGLVPKMDTTRAMTNLSNTRAAIPLLEQSLAATKNRIASLLGVYPNQIDPVLAQDGTIPEPPTLQQLQLPADMIRSRPDIRGAERELAAQTARIGVAKSDLYPKFTLTGFYELQALDADRLFDAGSQAWGLSPQVRWNIFSSGRIRNAVKVEEARTEQALARYENALLVAVEEVENALLGIQYEKERLRYLEEGVAATTETVELVRENYTSGLSDFQVVLDAERSLATDQDNSAVSRGEVSKNYIRLYKALGGGSPPPKEFVNEIDESFAKKSATFYIF